MYLVTFAISLIILWSEDESFLLYDDANHLACILIAFYYLNKNLEDALSPDPSKKYPTNYLFVFYIANHIKTFKL